jgi:5,10-methylenetetrahydrofolate reductase
MTLVVDALDRSERSVFICDFTPPRGADPSLVDGAARLAKAQFVAVAYNPGKLVRLDSVAAAFQIKQRFGQDVVFNLSPRDMNKIALQSRLLGAAALGLENVVVLQGDPLADRDNATSVADYKATGLIAAVRELNEGLDYRGGKLRSATDLCIGATLDLSRGIEAEARLAHRKAEAGAQFFLAQPVFSYEEVAAFHKAYRALAGGDLAAPVFWGVQVFAKDGVLFSSVPASVREQVEAGRDGVEIAREVYEALTAEGLRSFYLIAPILKGGARDYDAAGRFLEAVL